jgi:hypothetical protein
MTLSWRRAGRRTTVTYPSPVQVPPHDHHQRLPVTYATLSEALSLVWWAFRKAAGEDLAGWNLASAEAEVRPEGR